MEDPLGDLPFPGLAQIAALVLLLVGHVVLIGVACVVAVAFASRAFRAEAAMRATGAQRDRMMTGVVIAGGLPLAVALLSCVGMMTLERHLHDVAPYWAIGLAVVGIGSVAVGAALGHVRIASVEREGPNDAEDG